MTGIERLREFVAGISPITVVCGVTRTSYDREHMEVVGARLRDFLADIADQIERETIPREPGDGVVGPKTLHAMALAQLDDWERDAIAWVREHGGIAYVKDAWNVRSNLDRQLEKAQAKVERQQRHIMFVQTKCRERQEHICELNKLKSAYVDALNGVCKRLGLTDGTGLPDIPEVICAELDRRLMPEGMEWLVDAWPRFDDDAPLGCGDEVMTSDGAVKVEELSLTICDRDGGVTSIDFGERVRRPAPKVLDADGVEIREQRDAWWICDGDGRGIHAERLRVETIRQDGLVECSPCNGGTWVSLEPSELYVNKPVLASDGKPLREGETVWNEINGKRGKVVELTTNGNGERMLWVDFDDGSRMCCFPHAITHERLDSWERLEEDAEKHVCTYFCHSSSPQPPGCGHDVRSCRVDMAHDIVRRAKALAERDR